MELFWLNKYVLNLSYLVLKIAVSLLNGINYLHEEKTFHGEIRT